MTRILGRLRIHASKISKAKLSDFGLLFSIAQGSGHGAPDAMSRYPAAAAIENNPEMPSPGTTSKTVDVLDVIRRHDTPVEENASDEQESIACAISINALEHLSALNDKSLITIDQVNDICRYDGVYQKHAKAVNGFPKTRSITNPEIWEYWEVHSRRSLFRGIVLLDDRIAMPQALRKQILQSLYFAHQGCTGMKARANQCAYWPVMSKSISSYKANCGTCIINAPSQQRVPLILSPPPQWPFQQVCGDFFSVAGHDYLSIDRFSSWICIHHLGPRQCTSTSLISVCRSLFTVYDAPEQFSLDGGPQPNSTAFKEFLSRWGVSTVYHQLNTHNPMGEQSLA